MSTNNQTESTSKLSIWHDNTVIPQCPRTVAVISIHGSLHGAIANESGEFVVGEDKTIYLSTIWKWAYLDDLLKVTDFVFIPPNVFAERKKSFDDERAAHKQRVQNEQGKAKDILEAILSDIQSGKARVTEMNIIQIGKD